MSTAAVVKPETEVTITCQECHFLIPQYARKRLSTSAASRVDAMTCPTCHASYVVTVEQTRRTDLEPTKLDEIRNRNR